MVRYALYIYIYAVYMGFKQSRVWLVLYACTMVSRHDMCSLLQYDV